MLNRLQVVTLVTLFALPVLLFAALGGWALYQSGQFWVISWAFPLCWGANWLLLKYWKPNVGVPLPPHEEGHWTPRDLAALQLVTSQQDRGRELTPDQLTELQTYVDITKGLAQQLAAHYHPNAADPIDSVSVVELLAAVHLVVEDVEAWVVQNVPASHLVTIGQWKWGAKLAKEAPGWATFLSNAGWLGSIALNPLNAAPILSRYVLSRSVSEPLTQLVKNNLLASLYMLYVRQLGYYLIELNSGRLRGGSARFRAAIAQLQRHQAAASAATAAPTPVPAANLEPLVVTVAIVGQVKAGKSSLTNALLGDAQAAVDILPTTKTVSRHQLRWEDRPEQLVLLDTPGYADGGATPAELKETEAAWKAADLILLVLDSRSPAKAPDLQLLEKLDSWERQNPHRRPVPIIGVLNKIDGLSPMMEWSPPYDWQSPERPKEKSIRGALDYTQSVLGRHLDALVPICANFEHKMVYGIEEWLLPTMLVQLDDARAAALLKALHHDYDNQRTWQVLQQSVNAGRKLLEAAKQLWQKDHPPQPPGT